MTRIGLSPPAIDRKFRFFSSMPVIWKKGLSKSRLSSCSLMRRSSFVSLSGSMRPSGRISSMSFLLLSSSAASKPSTTCHSKSGTCSPFTSFITMAMVTEQSMPKMLRPVEKARPGWKTLSNISTWNVESWKNVSYSPHSSGISVTSNPQTAPSSSLRMSFTYHSATSRKLMACPMIMPASTSPLNDPYSSISLPGTPRSVAPARPTRWMTAVPMRNSAATPT
mmetsp:Transcript_1102/g.2464  ORF Transcript_1102/g.2464 Transcript_1102/m.2464 type:complete len:223 (-) Transcript_1102:2447-3115(-)